MEIHVTNPLTDPRWDDLVERHPRATAFHHRGWLSALARTYGYEPFALTSSAANEPLRDAVVLCGVASWITGKRLVSLPFADHCDLLLRRREDAQDFAGWLKAECQRRQYRYAELRPREQGDQCGLHAGQAFYFHVLDLTPSLNELFDGIHKGSGQRRIRRAEKQNLWCDVGRSAGHISEFYRLMLMTRRRHRLFPQPLSWFENLMECMGDKAKIWLARRDQSTVAAMLTLRHRASVMYKYGCSDERLHKLGGMPFLFWKLIEEGKSTGALEIDFGRSDTDNENLARFKERFGARRERLVYWQHSGVDHPVDTGRRGWGIFRSLFPIMPDRLLSTGGRLLYRHMG